MNNHSQVKEGILLYHALLSKVELFTLQLCVRVSDVSSQGMSLEVVSALPSIFSIKKNNMYSQDRRS